MGQIKSTKPTRAKAKNARDLSLKQRRASLIGRPYTQRLAFLAAVGFGPGKGRKRVKAFKSPSAHLEERSRWNQSQAITHVG